MKYQTLLLANCKRHRGTMLRIFIMMLAVSLTLISVITIWINSSSYIKTELERMNYGDITAWIRSVQNEESLLSEIEQIHDVESVTVQQLIYADYEIHDEHSDSEGQLIVYEPERFPYRIFNEDTDGYINEDIEISAGEIYVSASLLSAFQISTQDKISFPIGRQGNVKTFEIKGTFEDPFMGSSMIGMKSFLISQEDYVEINEMIEGAGINALAKTGRMLHIKQSLQSTLNNAQFNQLLNEQTSLGDAVEFVHSKSAITNFMLILQNAFAGLSMAFALILLLITVLIISYSIGTSMEQDESNMGILKTVGYDASMLRSLLKRQYLMVILFGVMLGMLLSYAAVPAIGKMMVSFAGILTPNKPHYLLWGIVLVSLTIFFYLFIHIKTKRISSIPPIAMIQKDQREGKRGNYMALKKKFLIIRISMRQLMSEKKRYISVYMTALLLVSITSMVGRMNSWLGPDGKGMMDAFNPADLDVGVQLIGNHNVQEMEEMMQRYSLITDSYKLAMPSVAVNGIDNTANVISDPQQFHIQQGTTSRKADEIVITEIVAADLGLQIGDRAVLSYNGKSASYVVAGIYQCANDMGGNIGMSEYGFLRIGEEAQDMWCYHYFLNQPKQKQNMINALNSKYGGDVYIHENTWPGLFSIIAAMKTLLIVMYVMSAFFTLIVTSMTGYKIFLFEKRNLSIYKALGFTVQRLRLTFAIRYGITAILGSFTGILISAAFTDTIVGALMKLYGISNFASHPDVLSVLLPGILVSLLFACFAYLTSGRLSQLNINELVSE